MTEADPFDRAVARERRFRNADRDADMNLAIRMNLVLVAGWALVLAGHWWLDGPGVVFTVHAIIFVLYAGFAIAATLFTRSMMARLRARQEASVDLE